jgi:hypothetical protein
VCAGGTGGHARLLPRELHLQLLILLLDGDAIGHGERQLTLGALDLDHVGGHGGGNALR